MSGAKAGATKGSGAKGSGAKGDGKPTGAKRFAEETRERLRSQILDAAGELTVDRGWDAVTMSAVAQRVGVSRQTVYNELGGKPALGEALVLRELDTVLTLVADELSGGGPLVPALSGVVESVLSTVADNPLLKDVVVSAHVGRASLLPWLTTDSGLLLTRATAGVMEVIGEWPEVRALSEPELERLVSSLVRLVLSHVVQPTAAPEVVAADVAWLIGRVLADG